MKSDSDRSDIAVGLLIWNEPLRNLVNESLRLLGIEVIQNLPTVFPPVLSRDYLQVFSQIDLVVAQAFNSTKVVLDPEGFRLAKLFQSSGSKPRTLVLFQRMSNELRQYPCFVDFATFATLSEKIDQLCFEQTPDGEAFLHAVQLMPELDRIPVHRRTG